MNKDYFGLQKHKAIGGYMGLELSRETKIYPSAVCFNSGKSSAKFILSYLDIGRVFIPKFTCTSLIESIEELGFKIELYDINESLEIKKITIHNERNVVLVNNYFGIKGDYVKQLKARLTCKLIVDNAQAFYSVPPKGIPAFNSCRKFFGVPDGSYLFNTDVNIDDIPQGQSYDHFSHLVKRLDVSPEFGYEDYKRNEKSLGQRGIERMSIATQRLLASVDHERVKAIRRKNYLHLDAELGHLNELSFPLSSSDVPLAYPFYIEGDGLRAHLISERIFVPTYWPGVEQRTDTGSIESNLTKYLISLPVDQRYGAEEMERIVDTVKSYI
jgi:hypothetical protein